METGSMRRNGDLNILWEKRHSERILSSLRSGNGVALSYTVHLSMDNEDDYRYPVLYGLENEERQNVINDTMAALLQEIADAFILGEHGQEIQVWSGATW